MGIKGLMKILNLDSIDLDDIKKFRVIGVDVSIW